MRVANYIYVQFPPYLPAPSWLLPLFPVVPNVCRKYCLERYRRGCAGPGQSGYIGQALQRDP